MEALRANNIDTSAFGNELATAQNELGLPANFERLGPRARIFALQNVTPDSQQLLHFLSIGAQKNILGQVRLTPPCVASGVPCYLSVCTLLNIAPFPPTTKTEARRSTVFRPGKTYVIYVEHLIKACHLVGFDIAWRTPLINSIAKGLSNKPSMRNPCRNSLTHAILDRIIRAESWESEFARLCFVTYLFMLRLPSESLILHRALPTDLLLTLILDLLKPLSGYGNFRVNSDSY